MVSQQLLDEIASGQGESLKSLAKRLPSFRNGKPATISRFFRWIFSGKRGPNGEIVKLEGVKTPSGWMTTPAALGRSFAALTPAPQDTGKPASRGRSASAWQKASERAAKQLEKLGI